MSRRLSSFAKALQDAEKRLEKALAERAYSQTKLGQLANEIPSLERTIAALKQQMNPADMPPGQLPVAAFDWKPIVPMPANDSEIAKLAGPQDLTGMGSIPYKQLSEDELLPEPEGEPLTED
jgi:hypothetical protein